MRSSLVCRLGCYGALVAASVPVGTNPSSITYDGANLWVTNVDSDSITVVSASTGAIVATICQ